jgi:hypothetical protein
MPETNDQIVQQAANPALFAEGGPEDCSEIEVRY